MVFVVLDNAADLMTDHHITMTHPCVPHATASDVLNAMREGSLGNGVSVKTKKNIHFEFSQDLVREPLLYQINRSFDVVVNIRGASVTDEGGFIALEREGTDDELQRVLDYLRDQGVKLGEGLGDEAGSGEG